MSQEQQPSVPDDVWQKFVRDHEKSQRKATAGQEPGEEPGKRARRIPVRIPLRAAAPAVAVAAVVAAMLLVPGHNKPAEQDHTTEAAPVGGQPKPNALAVPSGASVPSVRGSLPSDAPAALPSLLARPVISPEQAFPDETVKGESGTEYHRVDVASTTDCSRGVSPELAGVIGQGQGCLRLTSALYTDAAKQSRITIGVLSFKRAEDAAAVVGMASFDPLKYEVVSLDPPQGSGMDPVPPHTPATFNHLMTVRSTVFANAEWGDGRATDEPELSRENAELLGHFQRTIADYEEGRKG
ncbi:hypothetical protein CTZ27_27820 [Streptomyces griseocarneus]|nr:hypothetical protein CTZ27_27820 [Streptomyces griseocarneus]